MSWLEREAYYNEHPEEFKSFESSVMSSLSSANAAKAAAKATAGWLSRPTATGYHRVDYRHSGVHRSDFASAKPSASILASLGMTSLATMVSWAILAGACCWLLYYGVILALFLSQWIYVTVNEAFFPNHWTIKVRPGSSGIYWMVLKRDIRRILFGLQDIGLVVSQVIVSACFEASSFVWKPLPYLIARIADLGVYIAGRTSAYVEQLLGNAVEEHRRIQNTDTYVTWDHRRKRVLRRALRILETLLIAALVVMTLVHLYNTKGQSAPVVSTRFEWKQTPSRQQTRNLWGRFVHHGTTTETSWTTTTFSDCATTITATSKTINWESLTNTITDTTTETEWSTVRIEVPVGVPCVMDDTAAQTTGPSSKEPSSEMLTGTITETVTEYKDPANVTVTITETDLLKPETVTIPDRTTSFAAPSTVALLNFTETFTTTSTESITSTITKWTSEIDCAGRVEGHREDVPTDGTEYEFRIVGYETDQSDAKVKHFCHKCQQWHTSDTLTRRFVWVPIATH